MRSLLTLSFSFALLAAYLEWAAPVQHQDKPSQLSQIVRSQSVPTPRADIVSNSDAYHNTAQQPVTATKKALRILNLKLPMGAITDNSAIHLPSQLVLESSTANTANKIRYNAELVYDLDKGEDITGGKVNIEIPFG